MIDLRLMAMALLIGTAGPALAQSAPPAPPPVMAPPMMEGGRGMMAGPHGGRHAFASMSEAGRATMRNAMRDGGDRREDRDAIKAARERMLTILEADRLDTAALKRAMEDERRIAEGSHQRRQTAMLQAFQQLSVADRKAFVSDSRAMKSRMESRLDRWKQRRGERQADGAPRI